mgnify:CR=1 FL=1
MIETQSIVHGASRLALLLLILSVALAFFRLARGPQAADRVVALDLIAVLMVAFLGAFAVHAQNTSFLDVAIAYALIAFLGTVALSRYLLRSGKNSRQTQASRKKP